MSECEHEMIWVGSYTNLRCAKCNESYTAIQTEKVAQLEQALDMEAARSAEVLAENERLREIVDEQRGGSIALDVENDELREENAKLEAELSECRAENEWLRDRVAGELDTLRRGVKT